MPGLRPPARLRRRAPALALLATLVLTAASSLIEIRHLRRETDEERAYELREVQEGLSGLYRDLHMIGLLSAHQAHTGTDNAVADYVDARRDELSPVRWLGILAHPDARPQVVLASADFRSFSPRQDAAIAAVLAKNSKYEEQAVLPASHRGVASLALVLPMPAGDQASLVALVNVDDLLLSSLRAAAQPAVPFSLSWNGSRIGQWPSFPRQDDKDVVKTMTTSMASLDFTLAFQPPDWLRLLALALPTPLMVLLAGVAVAAALRVQGPQAPPKPIAITAVPPASGRAYRNRLWQLGDMAAALSHDLGQPLNVIRLTAESSLDALAQGRVDAERLSRGLNNAVEQTARAQEMMDAMVTASRRPSHPPAPLRPVELVRQSIARHLPAFKAGGIQLLWHAELATPPVHGHAPRMAAAIDHLLDNAARALAARRLDQGTGGTVRVECRPQDRDVVITIADNGPGFPPELHAALNNGTAELRGLGLTIALGVVAEMGGTLRIADTQPGTRITITLPATARSLLVVDDDTAAADELAKYLGGKGWLVRTAHGGNAALAAFECEPANAVVTDLDMADGDGWQLIERLRALAPDLPIVAVSAAADDDARRAVSVGAALIMRKPVSLRELSAELDSLFYCDW